MRSRVFISYARADSAFARRLHTALAEAGRDPWLDTDDLPPTLPWREGVQQAMATTDACVFVLSPASLGSPQCLEEVQLAATGGTRLVPLVHREPGPSAVPAVLRRVSWIYARDEDDFDSALRALLARV